MSKIPTSEEFFNMLGGSKDDIVKLATVKNGKILFDGEEIPSNKTFRRNANYALTEGDRVVLMKISGTYVVCFKIV